jgi:hypothetical protein
VFQGMKGRLTEAMRRVDEAIFRMSSANDSPSTRRQLQTNSTQDEDAIRTAEGALQSVSDDTFPVLCSQYGTQQMATSTINRCSVWQTEASTHVFACGHPLCNTCVKKLGNVLTGCALCNTDNATVVTLEFILQGTPP